jgi:hypothetical protein
MSSEQIPELLTHPLRLDQGEQIVDYLELILSFDLAGTPDVVEVRRGWLLEAVNRIIALAAAEAMTLVMTRIHPRAIR